MLVNSFVVKKVKLVNNFCQNNVHLNIYLAKNVIRNWWFDLGQIASILSMLTLLDRQKLPAC